MSKIRLSSAFMTAIAVALAASGAAASAIQLTTRVWKEQAVVASNGTTTIRLVPSDRAVPGDRLVYRIAYRNAAGAPIAGVVIDDPLPAGVTYTAPATGNAAPDVSVDGKSFGPLAMLRVPAADGVRPATLEDVTHLRWRVPAEVPPGGGGEVSFRAVLR